MYRYLKAYLAVLCIALAAGGALAQDAPKRSITQISGDLYRFQNNFHYSVFLVTSDGVIVTDPINAGAARWLKAEIAKPRSRFVLIDVCIYIYIYIYECEPMHIHARRIGKQS